MVGLGSGRLLRRGGVTSRGVATVVRRLGALAMLRLSRLMGTMRRRFNMSTTTTMTMTTPTTNNTTTIRRGARFSIVLGRINTRGVGIVGIIHRVANLNLTRTGTVISNTPGALGRTTTGRRTRRVGTGLTRINTAIRLTWFWTAVFGEGLGFRIPFFITG